MRGRSRITFKRKKHNRLEDLKQKDHHDELITKVKWLKHIAGLHSQLGNKLISIARRTKAGAAKSPEDARKEENSHLNDITAKAYTKLATKQAKRATISKEQKEQILKTWRKNSKHTDDDDHHIQDVQNAAVEFEEMLGEMTKCDPDNIIHTAKITRLGELHRNKAESYNNKLTSEIRQAKHEVNNDKKSGIKHISKAISGPRAKPLTCVNRERDSQDG